MGSGELHSSINNIREVPTFFDESKNIVTKQIYKKYKQVTSFMKNLELVCFGTNF